MVEALPRPHPVVAPAIAVSTQAGFVVVAAAADVAIPTELAFAVVAGLPSWHLATIAVLGQVAGPKTMVAAGAGLGAEPTRSGRIVAAKSAEDSALLVVAKPSDRQ